MITFEQFWQMLYDHGSRNYYQNEAYVRWSELSPDVQQQLYNRIRQKLDEGRYVDYNPLEAIHDNLPRKAQVRTLTMTYEEYYHTYRTTTDKDGWEKRLDANGKVYYAKTSQ